MKFNQAINEGFEKYVSDTSEKVEISKDLLQKVSDILEFTSSKLTHDENPDLYKNVIRSYFKIGEILREPSISNTEDEDEVSITGTGSRDSKTTYDVDDAVERLSQKPSRQLGGFGIGPAAYQAQRAVKEREKLNKQAIDVYKKNTNNIRTALNQKSNPFSL